MILEKGSVTGIELKCLRTDNTSFPANFSGAVINDETGNPSSIVSILENITERKQAEAELRQHRDRLEELIKDRTAELEMKNDRLADEIIEKELIQAKDAAESANRAKSSFLANMSHEIRTPMNTILGFSQLLMRDETLRTQQKQYLDTINRSGVHLLAIINEILEMSKIEAGRTNLNPNTFDLLALLKDIESMFHLRIEAKQLRFTVKHIGNLPRFVITDEGKLRQVFINLISNAVKFTKQGEIILRIRTRRDKTKGLRLITEVQDTGSGISPEDIKNLFEPFHQVGKDPRSESGTGLGLAISREFVRLMDGDITVISTKDKGCTFRFDIAITEASPDTKLEKMETRRVIGIKSGQTEYRVLIVDDNEENRDLLHHLLSPIGFLVNQVNDGEEALEKSAAWKPHLILMDMRMPVMDGLEAIRHIRQEIKNQKVKIITITASAFEENRQQMLAAGADDFLGKPFLQSKLFDKIGKLLNIQYIFEDEVVFTPTLPEIIETITPAALEVLPDSLIHQIREATINGDFDLLLELLSQVEPINAHLAQGLRLLALQFDAERILNLLPIGGTR